MIQAHARPAGPSTPPWQNCVRLHGPKAGSPPPPPPPSPPPSSPPGPTPAPPRESPLRGAPPHNLRTPTQSSLNRTPVLPPCTSRKFQRATGIAPLQGPWRSEERRVGKE